MLELLDLLGEFQPVVLMLEDMHWADRSTRTFAAFLARSLREERVLMLLTYRSDELHRRHVLRPLLAELDRLERAQRIELAPFDRAELTEALADILGDAPNPDLVERVFKRSEGNPLYTEELLAAGLDGRGAAPQSLRDAFMLRIERLSDVAQRAARVIAVGRALDEPMIGEATGIENETLHGALREAVAEQVLEAHEDGRLGFRHALLREALYDDLLPGERGELHLALAHLYEQQANGSEEWGVERATTIANHYAAGGDQPAALRATVLAGLAARDVHAYGEAADLAERALELWPRVSDPESLVPLDHVEAAVARRFRPRDRGRSLPRRGSPSEWLARAPGGRRSATALSTAGAVVAHPMDAQPRRRGRGDRTEGAGAAPRGRGEPRPGTAAGVAGSDPVSTRAFSRRDRGRR